MVFHFFSLRGVAPKEIQTRNIYKGVVPFIGIQVLAIMVVGLYQAAKYYYNPGWHEPATILDCSIDMFEWEKIR